MQATTIVAIVAAAAIGAAGWTFAEYLIHRFSMHAMRGRGLQSREHGRHHSRREYFTTTTQKTLTAIGGMAVIFPIVWSITDVPIAGAFCVGFITAYLAYELAHRRAHTHPPTGFYGRWLRRNHFAHHFVSPRRNFGFTTPVWDIVFRTTLDVESIRVPRRLAMSWLTDDAGDVRPEFAGDYRITGHNAPAEMFAAADEKAAFSNIAPALALADARIEV